jgi:hypothetical protein
MQPEFSPAEDRRASNLYIKPQFLPQREKTYHFNKTDHVQCNIYERSRKYLFRGKAINEIQGADKSLARPGRKQATSTEDFDFHISYL